MSWFALAIVAAAILGAVLVAGFVLFVLLLARRLGGTSGGWRRLTAAYATDGPPRGQVSAGQTVQVGAVVYKRCATLGVADEGLYLSIWRKTVLIPWSEVADVGETTLHWQRVPRLTIGRPAAATITLPPALFPAVQHKLPATPLVMR